MYQIIPYRTLPIYYEGLRFHVLYVIIMYLMPRKTRQNRISSHVRNPSLPYFIAHLKHEMKRRHWTQEELALVSGISQPRVSRILNGKHDLKLSTCDRLAGIFELDTIAYFGIRDPNAAHNPFEYRPPPDFNPVKGYGS